MSLATAVTSNSEADNMPHEARTTVPHLVLEDWVVEAICPPTCFPRSNALSKTTGPSVDPQNATQVIDTLREATELNLSHDRRHGATVELGSSGRLLVGGDVHDHRVNYDKLVKLARLGESTDHHLLIQEVVHGEQLVNGVDFSYRLLVETARLQVRYPAQVHVLLSNHELAQVNGEDIMKHGISSIEAFDDGLDYVFDDRADEVREAIHEYVYSYPLAVRCANGVLCAHSLPTPRKREQFDPMIISRELTGEDLIGPAGDAHLMVWGRNLSQTWADDLAALWNCQLFVLGHQQAEMGYELCGDTMLILASDHEHGVALPIDLSRTYSRAELIDEIIPLAAVSE